MPLKLTQLAAEDESTSSSTNTKKPSTEVEKEFGDHDGRVTTRSLDIKTVEDALRVSKVDLSVWEVERSKINSWEVTISGKRSSTEKDQTYTNYQVSIWLKRKVADAVRDGIELLLAEVKKGSRHASRPRPTRGARHLLEISLFDCHFGLYAWGKETGTDYDLRIAEQRYASAAADLLSKTREYAPDRILLPIGNDFFHINDTTGTTPRAHNKLDVDTRLAKVFKAGCNAAVALIDLCARQAQVDVIWVPGNHDPDTSFYLCSVIEARFHNHNGVTVDVSPKQRKYVHYGTSLIGFTHGDEEPHNSLPTIMAGECKDVWGRVKTCEWHLGHYHKRKEMRYNAGDSYGNVVVRVLPSISGTDSWHFKKGYVNGDKAADAFLYDKERGFVGYFTAHV